MLCRQIWRAENKQALVDGCFIDPKKINALDQQTTTTPPV
jgi:hypothetical protein